MPTSRGTLRIPQQLPGDTISLFGRQSRVIVTDYSFGQSSKLTYSTARILFAGTIGSRDVILLYGDRWEGTEFSVDDRVFSFPPSFLSSNQRRTNPHYSSTQMRPSRLRTSLLSYQILTRGHSSMRTGSLVAIAPFSSVVRISYGTLRFRATGLNPHFVAISTLARI